MERKVDDWSTSPVWADPRTPWDVPADTGLFGDEVFDGPRSSSGVGRRAIAIGVVVSMLAGFGGVTALRLALGGDDSRQASPSTSATTSSPAPTTPAGPGAAAPAAVADEALLRGLVVRASDVDKDVAVRLLPGGNQVVGQVTLDLCDGSYPSEALRAARLQVVALLEDQSQLLSTEAVLYESSAATAQAFREVRSVAAGCHGPVTTARAGIDDGWGATGGVERLAYEITSNEGGVSRRWLVVYLRRGRALMGVYLPQDTPRAASVDGHADTAQIVGVFESRLAALPSSVDSP